MHNIKLLREKPDFFKKKFQDRNMKLNIDELLNLDKKRYIIFFYGNDTLR